MNASELATLAIGPFLAACALLGAAGVAKLRDPEPTRKAALALRLPHSRRSVRLLGAGEIFFALAGAIFGGSAAFGVLAMYGFFAAVAVRLARSAPSTPCGCLGASETPAGVSHVVLDVSCALFALVAAFGERPIAVLADQPLAGIPFLALVLCGAWAATLAVEGLPALRTAVREETS